MTRKILKLQLTPFFYFALVFFHGYRTGWAFDLLIWTSKSLRIYKAFLWGGYVLFMNINNIILCIFGLTLWKANKTLFWVFEVDARFLLEKLWEVLGPNSGMSKYSKLPKAKFCTEHRRIPSNTDCIQSGYGAALYFESTRLQSALAALVPNSILGSPSKHTTCRSSKGVTLFYLAVPSFGPLDLFTFNEKTTGGSISNHLLPEGTL